GAAEAVAVDSSRRTLDSLEQLARSWELPLSTRQSEVRRFLANSNTLRPFDIVYVDPPYDFAHYDDVMNEIDSTLPLSRDAVVVVEHRKKREVSPARFERLAHRESRSWGQVGVEIFDVRYRSSDESDGKA
ncbi:MAG: RsmD family RNA methyltransferase, partial [Thermoanaerobaculia bacterium]|nr:RsmD family RNA methyltransferase [Thermoanaerobaculia bacterium]